MADPANEQPDGDEGRAARARARASWTVTRTDLDGQADVDLGSLTDEERLMLVAELTRQAWYLSGQRLPVYARHEMPGRLWRADEARPDE